MNVIKTIPKPVLSELSNMGGLEGIERKLDTEATLEKAATLFKALADGKRLKILEIVTLKPTCVCVIKELLAIQDSRLSYHLKVLKDAGLIESRQKRKFLYYYPTKLGKAMHRLLKRLQ